MDRHVGCEDVSVAEQRYRGSHLQLRENVPVQRDTKTRMRARSEPEPRQIALIDDLDAAGANRADLDVSAAVDRPGRPPPAATHRRPRGEPGEPRLAAVLGLGVAPDDRGKLELVDVAPSHPR